MLESILFSFTFMVSVFNMLSLILPVFRIEVTIPIICVWYIGYPSISYQIYFWFSKYGVL